MDDIYVHKTDGNTKDGYKNCQNRSYININRNRNNLSNAYNNLDYYTHNKHLDGGNVDINDAIYTDKKKSEEKIFFQNKSWINQKSMEYINNYDNINIIQRDNKNKEKDKTNQNYIHINNVHKISSDNLLRTHTDIIVQHKDMSKKRK